MLRSRTCKGQTSQCRQHPTRGKLARHHTRKCSASHVDEARHEEHLAEVLQHFGLVERIAKRQLVHGPAVDERVVDSEVEGRSDRQTAMRVARQPSQTHLLSETSGTFRVTMHIRCVLPNLIQRNEPDRRSCPQLRALGAATERLEVRIAVGGVVEPSSLPFQARTSGEDSTVLDGAQRSIRLQQGIQHTPGKHERTGCFDPIGEDDDRLRLASVAILPFAFGEAPNFRVADEARRERDGVAQQLGSLRLAHKRGVFEHCRDGDPLTVHAAERLFARSEISAICGCCRLSQTPPRRRGNHRCAMTNDGADLLCLL
jgi:hypothetical protein